MLPQRDVSERLTRCGQNGGDSLESYAMLRFREIQDLLQTIIRLTGPYFSEY